VWWRELGEGGNRRRGLVDIRAVGRVGERNRGWGGGTRGTLVFSLAVAILVAEPLLHVVLEAGGGVVLGRRAEHLDVYGGGKDSVELQVCG
jgi:hypothetical protein